MTINVEDTKELYTGGGSQVAFNFDFKVNRAEDLRVVRAVGTVEEDLQLVTDYSVTLSSNQNTNPGGVVTLRAPLTSGQRLAILRASPYVQPTAFTQGVHPQTLEAKFDNLTMQTQQLRERINRALTVAVSDLPAQLDAGTVANRANKVVSFDEYGDLQLALPLPEGSLTQDVFDSYLAGADDTTLQGAVNPRTEVEIAEGAQPNAPYVVPSHKALREVLLARYLTDAEMNAGGDVTDKINWALSVAQSSGALVVRLPSGTLNISDTLAVDAEGLALIGDGMFASVIKQTQINRHGFRINANKVLLRDLQIGGVGSTNNVEWRGIYLPGTDDVNIIRCAVIGAAGAGIYMGQISDGNDPTQTRSERGRIIDCLIEDISGPMINGSGIELAGAIDCIVRGNIIRRTKLHGIRANGCTRCVIDGNIIEDPAEMAGMTGIYIATATMLGLALLNGVDTIVTNNVVRFITPRGAGNFVGIGVYGASGAVVSGNRLIMDNPGTSADFRGVDIQTASLPVNNERITVADNIITGDGMHLGISLQHRCDGLVISGNHITGYVTAGIRDTSGGSGDGVVGIAYGNVLRPDAGTPGAYAFLRGAGASGLMAAYGNMVLGTNTGSVFAANGPAMLPGFGKFRRGVTRVGSQSRLEMVGLQSHPLETGDRIRFSSTGTLPSPLAADTDYYAVRHSDTTIEVASSLANAVAGTVITISNAGTGTHTVEAARVNWSNTSAS